MKKYFIFVLAFLCFIPANADAKRGSVSIVPPVIYHGYKYTAPHNEMGMLEVYEVKTGIKRWDMKVYDVKFNDDLEKDAQEVFIKELRIKGKNLVVIDEAARRDLVPLSLMIHWGDKGFDSKYRYSARYSRYEEGCIEIWVDAKETVESVGEIKLVFDSGKNISSKRCRKAQMHIDAPWACYFPQKKIKYLFDEKGKI